MSGEKKYLIYVACGSAAASANLVKERLRELLKKYKINAEMQIYRVAELANAVKLRRPDLIIITAGVYTKAGIPPDIPILIGIPLMTMVGVDDFMRQVINALQKSKS
jgi:galactitol-specific phosphotransferase system IIB component